MELATGRDVVREALKFIYVRYKFGAEVPLGVPEIPKFLDCSEFVQVVLHNLGIDFPDGSWNQYKVCQDVSVMFVAYHTPGALVFMKGHRDRIHHVGISTGTGCTIEARGYHPEIPGSGMVNIFPWRPGWDHAGLIKGVDYTTGA